MRLCWSCEHFYFHGGEPGYSEYTPGWDAEFSCEEKVFPDVGLGDLSRADDLKALIETAQTCGKFTPRLSPEEREKRLKAKREQEALEDAKKVSVINWGAKPAEEIKKPERVLQIGRHTWSKLSYELQGKHTPEEVKRIVLEVLGYYPEAGEYRIEIVDVTGVAGEQGKGTQ